MESQRGQFVRVPAELWTDNRLTLAEKGVLVSLLWHFNWELDRSWPSQAAIANETGLSQQWVRKVLKSLEVKGYITAFRAAGRNTQYAISIKPKKATDPETQFPPPETEFPTNDTKDPETEFPNPETQFRTPRNLVSVTPKLSFANLDKELDKELDNELDKNNAREKMPVKANRKSALQKANEKSAVEAEFETFWRAYPKPKNPDKSPGRRRYEALRKKGVSAEELLRAAVNYAKAMRGTEPRFIKHCATFLGPSDAWRDYLVETEEGSGASYPDYGETLPDWNELRGGEL